MILLAGRDAEALAGCGTSSNDKDVRRYNRILANLAEASEEWAKVDRRLRRATRLLLREKWRRVERIAEALEQRNFLHR